MMTVPDGYPEVLADLAALMADVLSADLSADQAADLALRIAERIRLTWGGQDIYIPRGVTYESLQRDQCLYAAFTGANHSQLAEQYGMALSKVYDAIDRERRRGRRGQ